MNISPLARHADTTRQNYDRLPRHSLIVCASLVQHPANLGGLCRTVEAFRLESLVMAECTIAKTAAFRGLAASAHHWQPIQICAIAALPTWLNQQQQAGYGLVALCADPTAMPISTFRYEQKSVLLLGQELTGIPSHLQAQCDAAVTIPQFGLVESLNVQTAGAIAIYEYMRQWGGV
jgi:tRNA guanosine-2'-O-methyltransferase